MFVMFSIIVWIGNQNVRKTINIDISSVLNISSPLAPYTAYMFNTTTIITSGSCQTKKQIPRKRCNNPI